MKKKRVFVFKNKVLVRIFDTTDECAEFFGKDREYIYHNLKYCEKIRKDGQWYEIKREQDV